MSCAVSIFEKFNKNMDDMDRLFFECLRWSFDPDNFDEFVDCQYKLINYFRLFQKIIHKIKGDELLIFNFCEFCTFPDIEYCCSSDNKVNPFGIFKEYWNSKKIAIENCNFPDNFLEGTIWI